MLSVFGGKITTYRKLAELALAKLAPYLPVMGSPWTGNAPLPGGDLPGGDLANFVDVARIRWPYLSADNALRLARAYGTRMSLILGDTTAWHDLGGGLSVQEIDYLVAHEWARSLEDILCRRSKVGLHLTPDEHIALERYAAKIGLSLG